MKIVQLITGSPSFGGAEAHVRDLSIGLTGLGHNCTVIVGGLEGLLVRQLRAEGIPLIVIPPFQKTLDPVKDASTLFTLIAVLRRLQPDILAAHTAKAGFIGRFASKLVGVPCVFTPHGQSYINRRNGRVIKHRLLLERLALRTGATTILVSEAERRLADTYLGPQNNSFVVIHSGIPDRTLARRQMKSRVRLAMVARFDHQKDHFTLLRALSGMMELDWEISLVGTGPLLPATKVFAQECGISSRVYFPGECEDVPGLLEHTDVFVLTSNLEAFPISILEAMRAGLPIVATDTGGVREAVIEGENGFLVGRADSRAVAEKLTLLIKRSDLRSTMSASSRKRFLDNYRITSMLSKTETVYKNLLLEKKQSVFASACSASEPGKTL